MSPATSCTTLILPPCPQHERLPVLWMSCLRSFAHAVPFSWNVLPPNILPELTLPPVGSHRGSLALPHAAHLVPCAPPTQHLLMDMSELPARLGRRQQQEPGLRYLSSARPGACRGGGSDKWGKCLRWAEVGDLSQVELSAVKSILDEVSGGDEVKWSWVEH